LNEQAYIASGAIEACILGIASVEEVDYYNEMRSNSEAVKAYADSFELSLEAHHISNNFLEPKKDLFAAIQHKIDTTKEADNAPVISIAPKVAMHSKSIWKQYGVAASIALLLGSTIFNVILTQKVKSLQTQVTDLAKNNTKNSPVINTNAQFAFLKEPTITPIAMYGVGSHGICKCSIYLDATTNKAYFITHHLFNPGPNNDYQLWAMVNGKPISAGIVTLNDDKSPILIENIPAGATGFYLTLEKKGGATKPTMEQMYLNGQIST
jgi:Anti-sigma-K factor rskA